MLSKKKISPARTSLFSALILENICELEENEVSKNIHHRLREIIKKLKVNLPKKKKLPITKKQLNNSIINYLKLRELAKELEQLGTKLFKVSNKFAHNDIKNAIRLAKASSKSMVESIKTNKQALKGDI